MKRQYTLVEIIRDPRMMICEASEMTQDGHYYLYRYNATEKKFYRATVPSGAASTHFQVLELLCQPMPDWLGITDQPRIGSSLFYHLITAHTDRDTRLPQIRRNVGTDDRNPSQQIGIKIIFTLDGTPMNDLGDFGLYQLTESFLSLGLFIATARVTDSEGCDGRARR